MTEFAASSDHTERRPAPGLADLTEVTRTPDEPYGPSPFRQAVDPLSMPRPQRDIWIRKQILATIEKRSPAVQIANLRRILALKRRGPI